MLYFGMYTESRNLVFFNSSLIVPTIGKSKHVEEIAVVQERHRY